MTMFEIKYSHGDKVDYKKEVNYKEEYGVDLDDGYSFEEHEQYIN